MAGRRRNQRLMMLGAGAAVLVLAAALTLAGLRDSVVYFVSPSQLAHMGASSHRLRLGGLVVEGTMRRTPDGATHFAVTDGAVQVAVRYVGPPTTGLVRGGAGVVAEGVWAPGGEFQAERVLAKHDERYMPREVAEALKQRGQWRGPP